MASTKDEELVHKSAHPNLSPIHPEQVVQFLLARNYYLTALELLLESDRAGKEDEVKELKLFFSDVDKFSPEELSKYQNSNALDAQTTAKEREERLQLAEYELRLAKEDLADMQTRLMQATTALAETQDAKSADVSSTQPPDPETTATGAPGVLGLAPTSARISDAGAGHRRTGSMRVMSMSGEEVTMDEVKAVNAAIVTHFLARGYRTSAMTFTEEAAGEIGSEPETNSPMLVKWRRDSHSLSVLKDANSAETGTSGTDAKAEAEQKMEALSTQLAESKNLIAKLQAELAEAARVRDSLREESGRAARSREREQKIRADAEQSNVPETSAVSAGGSGRANHVDGALDDELLALREVLALLTQQLPRLVGHVASKARTDMLPVMRATLLATTAEDGRRAMLSTIFNLSSAPDAAQRQAIRGIILGLARHYGPSWSAAEVLPLCIKNVNHQSGERRMLVGEMLCDLVGLLDLGTQAHVVLTLFHRLGSDRVEGVREASMTGVAMLLSKLKYSKSYYAMVEEMLLAMVRDPSDLIYNALLSRLLPALLDWSSDTEQVTTSLLPKVVTELSRTVRSGVVAANAAQQRDGVARGTSPFHTSVSMSAGPRGTSGPHRTGSTSSTDFQVVIQLLGLVTALLPGLKEAALNSCPQWVTELHEKKPYNPFEAEEKGGEKKAYNPFESPEAPSSRGGGTPAADRASSEEGSQAGREAHAPTTSSGPEHLFAVWAETQPPHAQGWKMLTWLTSFLMPELLDVVKVVPMSDDTLEVRVQCTAAFNSICATFGTDFTRLALLPLIICAAGAMTPDSAGWSGLTWLLGGEVAAHVREAAEDLAPRASEATRFCRQRVLPILFASILPATSLLAPYLTRTLGGGGAGRGWVADSTSEITGALAFAATLPDLTSEIVGVLEVLVQEPTVGSAQGAIAVGRALSGPCSPEVLARRVVPALVALLGRSDERLRVSVVGVLGEILLLHQEEGRLVEQLLATMDGVIESATSHEVHIAVLRVCSQLASAVAPVATQSASAATQVEWLLTAVRGLASQLAANAPLIRSADQQRSLAVQLVGLAQSISAGGVQLPRLAANFNIALEVLGRSKHLLPELQRDWLKDAQASNGGEGRQEPGLIKSKFSDLKQRFKDRNKKTGSGTEQTSSQATSPSPSVTTGSRTNNSGSGLPTAISFFSDDEAEDTLS